MPDAVPGKRKKACTQRRRTKAIRSDTDAFFFLVDGSVSLVQFSGASFTAHAVPEVVKAL